MTNVDRTPRNPNLLVWHDRVWLIDHGAALYFHHRDWEPGGRRGASRSRRSPTTCCCRARARSLEADARLAERLTADALRDAVSLVPAEWADRERYLDYLARRLAAAARVRAARGAQRGAAA